MTLEPKLETPDIAGIERFLQSWQEHNAQTGSYMTPKHYLQTVYQNPKKTNPPIIERSIDAYRRRKPYGLFDCLP
jgi:hypothetical protein